MSATQVILATALAVLHDGEPDPAPEIVRRLHNLQVLPAPLGMADQEVLRRKVLGALQSGATFKEKAALVALVLVQDGDLVDPAPAVERMLPRDRRRAQSDAERQDENVYQGFETADGSLHPLALVPPEVLEAARAALHEVLIEDGEIPIDMASPVADSIVSQLLPSMRPDWIPGSDQDDLAVLAQVAGMTDDESEVWVALRDAAHVALELIDADCQHTMEKAEVCTMFHGLQRWVAARPFHRQLLGLDGGPDDPRGDDGFTDPVPLRGLGDVPSWFRS